MSRGKVLARVYELREELKIFLTEQKMFDDAKLLASDEWCARLAYMADTFAYLNELNVRMQGRDENFLSSTDKINGFCSRISLCRQHLERGDTLEMFPLAQKWQEQVNTSALCKLIKKHLKTLEEKISFYFPSANTNSFDWVRDPCG